MTWYRPGGYPELFDLVSSGGVMVGGGVGLSSAAFPGDLSASCLIDLSLVLGDSASAQRIGARATLSTIAATDGVPRAVAQAAAATANPNLRRRITAGGVLGWRGYTADLPVALAAVGARVGCVDVSGRQDRMSVSQLSAAQGSRFLISEIDLPHHGVSSYRRISARRGPAPALASVAGYRHDNEITLVAGAVARRPICFTPDTRPTCADMISDHRASAAYRARLTAHLTDLVMKDLEDGHGE